MRRFLFSLLLLASGVASAQIDWLNPVNGDWSDATKWAGGNVPDNAGEIAQIAVAGGYTIEFNGSYTIGGLLLTNPSALLNIQANRTMALGGTVWTNDGLVVLNSTALNTGTYLRTDVAALTLGGGGVLRLNAFPGNLDTAAWTTNNGGFRVTNAPAHSIKGTGIIRVGMDNQGLIEADGPGRLLALSQYDKTNTGEVRASGGGTLQINGIDVVNAGGELVATGGGSVLEITGSSVSGGTLTATGGGLSRTSNSTYSGVVFEGAHQAVSNAALAIAGPGITNNGTLTLNPTAANAGTYFRTDAAAATLGGTGTLLLNASPLNLDSAQMNTNNGAYVLTNAATHTIRGIGRIRIAIVNDGVIRADGPGEFIDHAQFNKTNNNVIEALNGGKVQFSGIDVTNAQDAVLRADGPGSLAVYSSSGIRYGELIASNGALGSISNSTFTDLTMTGLYQINANTALALAGTGLRLDGLLTVNPTKENAGTYLRIDSSTMLLDGAGTVRLSAFPANPDSAQINTNNGNYALTIGPNLVIDGGGAIRVNTTNNGLIDANVPGEAIALRQFGKTNNTLMRATNGARLSIESIGVANNGEIRAEGVGSVVLYTNSDVTGGQLVASGGGLGSISNGTFTDVAISGPHQLNANTTMAIAGTTFTNNGLLTINPTGDNAGTALRTDAAAMSIGGTGRIHLNANLANPDSAQLNTLNGSYVLTLGAGQIVDGTGAIRINTVNNGLIDSNVPGGTLALRQFPKTNNAVMQATGGAMLSFESIGVTNNGEIRAAGADSIANYSNSTITGGQLAAVGGGLGVIAGGTFADLTLTGPHQLNVGTMLSIEGAGIINDGVLTINASAANQGTYLRTNVAAATIGGGGAVLLNAEPTNLDSAQLYTSSGAYVLTIGPGQTLAGKGAIRVSTVLAGTLSPGTSAGAIGRIEQRQFGMTMAPTATIEVDLNGLAAGEFDTFGANGAVALDGTLRVHVAAGFVPQLGDEFVILTAGSRSGTFEQIVTPNPGSNNAWRVRYEPTRAVLTVTCPPDIDGDHAVSLQDLAQLLAHFGMQSGAAGEDGDMDGDTDVDLQDLASLLATFGTTCP